MHHYKDGPHIHEYLAEFRKVCDEYGAVQIGEGPMTTVNSAMKYLSGDTKSMDMMFSFDHMMADCLFTEYFHRPFSLIKFKTAISRWQYKLADTAWNSLYLENHDHPRVISRYGSEKFHRESGTALATAYMFLKGTPFIYQGQEIGMTNIRLSSIDQYVDVSSKNNYIRYHVKDPVEARLHRIHISSRDSARTPMQWDATENAGFTTGKPWFYVNPNYRYINVAAQERDEDSILNYYRKCVELREGNQVLLFGEYKEYAHKNPFVYMYERRKGRTSYFVICSFTGEPITFKLPRGFGGHTAKIMLSNYPEKRTPGEIRIMPEDGLKLAPYEALVIKMKRV